ncbi:hypothetical protein H1C71_015358, partial [Ictidomys tridecemlineatus]
QAWPPRVLFLFFFQSLLILFFFFSNNLRRPAPRPGFASFEKHIRQCGRLVVPNRGLGASCLASKGSLLVFIKQGTERHLWAPRGQGRGAPLIISRRSGWVTPRWKCPGPVCWVVRRQGVHQMGHRGLMLGSVEPRTEPALGWGAAGGAGRPGPLGRVRQAILFQLSSTLEM